MFLLFVKYVNFFLNFFFISEDIEYKMILVGFSCLWYICMLFVLIMLLINNVENIFVFNLINSVIIIFVIDGIILMLLL